MAAAGSAASAAWSLSSKRGVELMAARRVDDTDVVDGTPKRELDGNICKAEEAGSLETILQRCCI